VVAIQEPYAVHGEENVKAVLDRPGVVFTCCGYQYRTTESGLECWGLDATGDMGWRDMERDRPLLLKHSIRVLKEAAPKLPAPQDALREEFPFSKPVPEMFIPDDVQLSNKHCRLAYINTRCACPPDRCWYNEQKKRRAAGETAISWESWRDLVHSIRRVSP